MRDLILKTQHLDATICALQLQNDEMLNDLEELKLHATPTETTEINRRMEELKKMSLSDMEKLKELQVVMMKQSSFEDDYSGDLFVSLQNTKNYDFTVPGCHNFVTLVSEILESRGLRLTPSGYFLTETGRLLTYSEASCMGLLEGIEHISWESILRTYKDKESSSERSLTTASISKIILFRNRNILH